ncbi:hypothetical protein AK830_g8860, partial [Neonectria ditissima]
ASGEYSPSPKPKPRDLTSTPTPTPAAAIVIVIFVVVDSASFEVDASQHTRGSQDASDAVSAMHTIMCGLRPDRSMLLPPFPDADPKAPTTPPPPEQPKPLRQATPRAVDFYLGAIEEVRVHQTASSSSLTSSPTGWLRDMHITHMQMPKLEEGMEVWKSGSFEKERRGPARMSPLGWSCLEQPSSGPEVPEVGMPVNTEALSPLSPLDPSSMMNPIRSRLRVQLAW